LDISKFGAIPSGAAPVGSGQILRAEVAPGRLAGWPAAAPVNVKALSEACSPGSRFLFAALLAALSVCGVVGEFEFFQ
jgi:hypothetical protein